MVLETFIFFFYFFRSKELSAINLLISESPPASEEVLFAEKRTDIRLSATPKNFRSLSRVMSTAAGFSLPQPPSPHSVPDLVKSLGASLFWIIFTVWLPALVSVGFPGGLATDDGAYTRRLAGASSLATTLGGGGRPAGIVAFVESRLSTRCSVERRRYACRTSTRVVEVVSNTPPFSSF